MTAYIPMKDLPRSEQVALYENRRRYYLPDAIELAERKLAALYREAKRLDLDLLEGKCAFNEAWDRAVLTAQIEATVKDMRG